MPSSERWLPSCARADRSLSKALWPRFEPVLEVSRPYLARMLARCDLEVLEHALIDAQMLPTLGF